MNENPKIVAYCCTNSAYRAADAAGSMRKPLGDDVRIVRVPCAGRVDVNHVMKAFEMGADGVLLMACPEGSCKYIEGNVRARKRTDHAQELIKELGLEPERVQIVNLSANDGAKFGRFIDQMREKLKKTDSAGVKPATKAD